MKRNRTLMYLSWIVSAMLLVMINACGGTSVLPGGSGNYWETESNDSSSQANQLPLNYSPGSDGYDYTGVIASDDTSEDWYRLTTSQSGRLSVTLSSADLSSGEHIYIALYNSALSELDSPALSWSSGGSVTASTASSASAGTYYVRIDADSWTLRYNLDPSFSTGGATSDYWESESNDSSSQANQMSLNYSPGSDGYDYTGAISSDDTSDDWYRLVVTQSGQLSVSIICDDLASNEHLYITLYDSALNELDAPALSGTSSGSVTASTAASSSAGTYYVQIEADSWTHRYDLEPNFSTGGAASDYWEQESNDSSSQADAMSLNYSPATDGYDYTGVIASNDTSEDWYRLATTQSGQLAVTLTCMDLASNEHIYITIYDSTLYELDAPALSGSPGGSITASTDTGSPAGTYYVRIDADSSTHRYDLEPSFSAGGAVYDYWEIEANDNSNQADAMSLNYSPAADGYDYTGVITPVDTSDDWYRLTTTQSGRLTVTLICTDLVSNEHIYITLYNSALNAIDSPTLSGTPGGSVTASTSSSAAAGTYYVKINADSWTHRYDLDPTFTP
jgi:hypothetical protein